jgi:drug/metabolite transporter (DMT)-like permease
MEEITIKTENTKKLKAYFYLFFSAFAWALANILVKIYVDAIPPFHLMLGRFFLASIFIFLTKPKKVLDIKKDDVKIGSILGFAIFLSYASSIIALKYTSASKASFLVALSVLFIPIVESFLKKKLPGKWTAISVIFSIIGLKLISGMNGTGFNIGDLIAISCSAFYTVYILILDRFGNDKDDFIITLVQLIAVSVISLISVLLFEGFNIKYIKAGLLPIFIIGIFSTALSTLLQAKALKYASSESAGIILLGEPLFTLIMAYFILQETILFSGLMGSILILSSLVIAVVKKI